MPYPLYTNGDHITAQENKPPLHPNSEERVTGANLKVNRIAKRAMSMAWYCSGSSNTELIENLFKAGLIKNERVKDAMLRVSILFHRILPFM